MDFYRIQDKMISREKIMAGINRILELRVQGYSQQEAADRLGIDRTFISRLETLGEVRKGRTIAVIGFPVANKQEILDLCSQEGVDFVWIMTESERIEYASGKSGAELLNELMDLIVRVREYDAAVLMASNFRLKLMRGILDKEVITIEIGESPLTEDRPVEPEALKRILRAIRGARRETKGAASKA